MAIPPKPKHKYEQGIVETENGWVGHFKVDGILSGSTRAMPNEHNAKIALRNLIMRHNTIHRTKIPLPISERKPVRGDGDASDRARLSGIALGRF